MNPNGPSSFDDDDGVSGSPLRTQVQPPGAPVREKPITAERSGSMARITKTYPQQEGTVFPRELLEFAIDAAREGYVRTANMGAAFNIMKRQVKDRWTMEKGPSGYVFKEHIHPLESYLRPSVRHDEAHKPAPPAPREKPAVPESEPVAEARKRWDAAKTSGDASAMTRAANDLLRAVEADRAARGENAPAQTEGGQHPTSEILAPAEGHGTSDSGIAAAATQAIANGTTAAANEIFGASLSPREDGKASAEAPGDGDVADTVDNWDGVADWLSSTYSPDDKLPPADETERGGLAEDALKRAAEIIERILPEQRGEALRGLAERVGSEQAARVISLLSTPDSVGNAEQWRNIVEGDDAERAGGVRALAARSNAIENDPLEPAEEPKPKRSADGRDRRDPLYLDWSQQATRARLARMANEPLTPLALLHLANEVYGRETGDPAIPESFPPGWTVVAVSTEHWMTTADRKSGYYAVAVYHAASGSLIIVNRGTESVIDGVATYDLKSGSWNAQLGAARNFFSLVQTRIGQIEAMGMKVRNCVATGHSLGGALAQYQVMLSRNLRPEDIDYRQGAPKFVGVTFSAARARGALEAAVARTYDNKMIAVTDASGRRHARRRRDVYALETTDSFQQYLVDYTMAGDGIALGDFIGDGNRDVPRARQNMVGRAVVLAGLDMSRVQYWRRQYNRWRRPEIRIPLGQLNMANHSLQNFTGSGGQLQSPLEDVVFDYRR